MWFHIGCHPAACVLFHRSVFLVKNTTVSKLLSYTKIHAVTPGFRFSQRYKQPTISSVIWYYVTVYWLLMFREKVGLLYSKGQNDEDDSALCKYNHHISSKISENQWRGDVTTHLVVLVTRWDEAVECMTGKNLNHKIFLEYLNGSHHLEWIFVEEPILLIWVLNKYTWR